MKLKLSNDEIFAVANIVDTICNDYRMNFSALSMIDKLHLSILEEMLYALRKKCLLKKPLYSVNLKPPWAISFHLCANSMVVIETYEGRAVQRICDQIHQTYS